MQVQGFSEAQQNERAHKAIFKVIDKIVQLLTAPPS